MKATIKAGILRDALLAVRALIPECRLHLTREGFQTRCIDIANVALVEMQIPRAVFEDLEAGTEEIGLELEPLLRALALAKADDEVRLVLAKSRLSVVFGSTRYATQLLDPVSIRKDPSPPTISHTANIKVVGAELAGAIKTVGGFSDRIRISSDPKKGLTLEGEGNVDEIRVALTPLSIAGDPAASLFSTDYLGEMTKALGASGEVTVGLGNDMPLRLDLDLQGCGISYLLAPRIEDDTPHTGEDQGP